MKRVTLHPEAEEELRTSERFYEERGGHRLALDFARRVQAALQLIAANPERFPRFPQYRQVQRARVTRFPFLIYYIDRERDIWVIAIAHGKRRPGYWEDGSDLQSSREATATMIRPANHTNRREIGFNAETQRRKGGTLDFVNSWNAECRALTQMARLLIPAVALTTPLP